MVFFVTIAGFALTTASTRAHTTDANLRLSYDRPAQTWTEALPLGNGRLGAMVFGGPEDERLQINESTLWGGQPHDYNQPEAYRYLPDVRRLIFAGKVEQAEAIATKMLGAPPTLAPYQPFGNIRLHFPGHATASAYTRDLRLDDAIASTTYTVGDVTYHREVFISYPDQVLVVRLSASKQEQLTFDVSLDSPQPSTNVQTVGETVLRMTGQIQPRQNPPWSLAASWTRPGETFAGILKVVTEGGSIRASHGQLHIAHANAVTLLFDAATSFRNYHDISSDPLASASLTVDRASASSYAELRQRHMDDFHRLFDRVRLQLGNAPREQTTDARLRNFAKNDDPSLVALYFAFGRYLLISSSRPGGQPANLQGIWNDELLPPWGSKWTTNINLEMNYWLAETGDLWETEDPLWHMIGDLRQTGAETARIYYHSDGWVLHHNTDLWRATTPVDGVWGLWPMGGVWLANQMWDHYEFSCDRTFLEQQAYPAMKGAVEFVLGTLVRAPAGTRFAGKLVTNPSTSPENQYLLQGKPVHLTYASTMDIELISALFANYQRASEILQVDHDLRARVEQAGKELPPLQIGKRGQLQEWIDDYAEAEPSHRHVSHLYALYPGRSIDPDRTPKLAAAAKRTLLLRGDGGTGWARSWRVALWARLRDGEQAYALLKLLLTHNTLPNLFDLCPPFQIDGNFGAPAGIMEMLVQSGDGEIRVLPALPHEWPDGSLNGVRVRGGARVNIEWHQGKLTGIELQTEHAAAYRVIYGDLVADVQLSVGTPLRLDKDLRPQQIPQNSDIEPRKIR